MYVDFQKKEIVNVLPEYFGTKKICEEYSELIYSFAQSEMISFKQNMDEVRRNFSNPPPVQGNACDPDTCNTQLGNTLTKQDRYNIDVKIRIN